MNNAFDEPTIVWHSTDAPDRPLVVLLHGRGADEAGIINLAGHLPAGPSYAAVRAPIPAGSGYAWFANRGIGRPVAESLNQTMAWFRAWLDHVAPAGRQVILVGFSGGAAFAGGLLLSDPQRFAGAPQSCTERYRSTPASRRRRRAWLVCPCSSPTAKRTP
jgi:phospholipase/carboxylesterase